jgi:acetoin utilization deacetylase AcuC-like enzyme
MLPVIYSDEFLKHDTGRFHPERAERLIAIVNALKAAPWADKIEWQLPTPVETRPVMPLLQQIHAQRYIDTVEQIASDGGGMLDGDTPISARSYDIAMLAVSAWLDGVDDVLATGNPAFVLARPPGHHAERSTGMGFCLFSNAAIAAYHALEQPGIQRVAILDWDVHHGNGTQDIVEATLELSTVRCINRPAIPVLVKLLSEASTTMC